MTSETNESELPEAQYADIIDFAITEGATIRLESELLSANYEAWRENQLECGVKVTQDGPHIGISAGTVNEAKLPHLYIHNGLSPDQARRLGDALHQAADNAEGYTTSENDRVESEKGFLRRLMG